jgi:hypothetical protein
MTGFSCIDGCFVGARDVIGQTLTFGTAGVRIRRKGRSQRLSRRGHHTVNDGEADGGGHVLLQDGETSMQRVCDELVGISSSLDLSLALGAEFVLSLDIGFVRDR